MIVDIIPEQECEVITVAAGGYVVRFDLARDDKTASDFVLYELRKFVNNGSRGKSLRSRVRAAVSILNNLQLP